MMSDLEIRFIPVDEMEVRLEEGTEGQPNKLVGYPAKFNSLSKTLRHEKYGEFKEVIRHNAFQRSLDNKDDVILNIDHDNARLIARTSAGNLTLVEDEVGLRMEAILPNTTKAKDLMEDIRVGNYKGMSFAFTTQKDDFRKEPTGNIRELHDVNLKDVSVVYAPAYNHTEVALRSFELWNEARASEEVEAKEEPATTVNNVQLAKMKLAELNNKYLKAIS